MRLTHPRRPRQGDELRRIVLDKREQEALKDGMRRQHHTAEEKRRRTTRGHGHLQRPSGKAAAYVTDWDAGIGIYPKMLWDRIVLAGYEHLLPAELADFRKMLNGDPRRPFSPELLRVTLAQVRLDYDEFLGLGPRLPGYLDMLVTEAESIAGLPIPDAEIAERFRVALDDQMRRLAELLARQKAEGLRDPQVGLACVNAVSDELPKLIAVVHRAVLEARNRERTPARRAS